MKVRYVLTRLKSERLKMLNELERLRVENWVLRCGPDITSVAPLPPLVVRRLDPDGTGSRATAPTPSQSTPVSESDKERELSVESEES